MQTIYPACFYEEEDGQYSVIFPDLNHLATCGKNLQEAIEMAVDCLAAYIYSADKSTCINPPSSIDEIDINAEYDGYKKAFVNYVSVNVDEYAKKHFEKAVKKTLTIPSWLNELALEKGVNFSAVLQEALKEKLNIK